MHIEKRNRFAERGKGPFREGRAEGERKREEEEEKKKFILWALKDESGLPGEEG